MLWDEQERTGKSIEEIAADFVKASRPSSIIQRVATVEKVANLAISVASPYGRQLWAPPLASTARSRLPWNGNDPRVGLLSVR
jgi:hypothetical protein